jgi:mannan endo-1,4-beta-mannosidase
MKIGTARRCALATGIVLLGAVGGARSQATVAPPGQSAAPPPPPTFSAGGAPRAAWAEPHPEIPYLPKPPLQPADWLVEHAPVTPNASPEARALLHFLYTISGKHTLTGQHNFPAQQEVSTGLATTQSGKTPALYGTDWGFAVAGDKDSAYVRHEEVKEIIKQWRAGSVIALCWHAVPPTEDEPVTFRHDVQSHITDAQFADLLTPGTDVYKHWCVQVDIIAEYLKQLQDAHVPVLWRPYHEINGDWFWWNGHRGDDTHGTKQLYRQLFDRLVNFHHLTNLIWVWNCDQPARADRQFVDYFPGQQYVDVFALDCYGAFQQSFYDDMNALSDGKVMAISETSRPPAIDVYKTQPKWTYYMRWAMDQRPPRRFPGGPGPGGPAGAPGPAPGGPAGALGSAPGGPPRGPRAAAAGGFGFGGARGGPDLRVLVADPRMFSLSDPEYWTAINPVRQASGLEPITVPPPGAPPPPPTP